jgi:hypothetical protein
MPLHGFWLEISLEISQLFAPKTEVVIRSDP